VADTDPAQPEQNRYRGLKPFQPGQSGNPAGRPLGSRNKLGEAFIQALQEDFAEHGVEAVRKVRAEKPDQYLKVIASLMPKEHRLSFDDQYDGMTDAELAERIRQQLAHLAPFLDAGIGGDDASSESKALPCFAPGVH